MGCLLCLRWSNAVGDIAEVLHLKRSSKLMQGGFVSCLKSPWNAFTYLVQTWVYISTWCIILPQIESSRWHQTFLSAETRGVQQREIPSTLSGTRSQRSCLCGKEKLPCCLKEEKKIALTFPAEKTECLRPWLDNPVLAIEMYAWHFKEKPPQEIFDNVANCLYFASTFCFQKAWLGRLAAKCYCCW